MESAKHQQLALGALAEPGSGPFTHVTILAFDSIDQERCAEEVSLSPKPAVTKLEFTISALAILEDTTCREQ